MDNPTTSKNSWLQAKRNLLLIGGPVVFLLLTAIIYLFTGRYVSTDDSYVQIARTEISSNVSGRVVEILVQDNQQVQQGAVLFKIDERDFMVVVNNARAKYANAQLQIEALKASYRQRLAEKRVTKNLLDYTRIEFKRQRALVTQGISAQAQLDQAREEFISAQQRLAASEQELSAALASLDNNPDIATVDHPLVQQAQAELDQALLNLSYTKILAPTDGIVSKVEQLQVGDYLKAAEPAFALVSNTDIWVEANFKETDLTYVRPGQTVTITVDLYPGTVFHGRVISLSPGTGASFSLLPPENATGNWVKVVQRLPVRISIEDLDPNLPLRLGLSANVNVDTHYTRLDRMK